MKPKKDHLPTVKKKVRETPVISEYELQKQCVQWLELLIARGANIKYTSIPNETYTTSWGQKAKNKAKGLHRGLPDMLILIDNEVSEFSETIWVEFKVGRNKSSKEQDDWQSALTTAGHTVFEIRDFETFKRKIGLWIQ